MGAGVHVNLDDAWDSAGLPMRTVDARPLGSHLRYTAPEGIIQRAYEVLKEGLGEERFVLYGSGDFHYLAAWWMRAVLEKWGDSAVVLVSFDNHPDWDIRPPRWACGGWVNRALEMKQVSRAVVWGCGNFELAFPGRLFRNRRALAKGRMEVHGWAERQTAGTARRFDCMTRENWRERFSGFARALAGQKIYVTIDLDALESQYAATNWENGLFTPEDLVWALGELRHGGQGGDNCSGRGGIVAGDCCGAYSPAAYARRGQRFAGNFDHPKMVQTLEGARAVNHRTIDIIWPALVGL